MRAIIVLCVLAGIAGCNTTTQAGPADVPVKTVLDQNGCPVEVVADMSCTNFPHALPGSICREKGKKVAWQAVDQSGNTLTNEFAVRFNAGQQILAKDGATSKCPASKNGVIKCKVKTGRTVESDKTYKYVVQVDNTECGVLDPRFYVP